MMAVTQYPQQQQQQQQMIPQSGYNFMNSAGVYVHSNPPRPLISSSTSTNSTINTTIRNWVKNGDVDKLENIVLEGQGARLLGLMDATTDVKVKTFLRGIPGYMAKVDLIHDAVIRGSVRELQTLVDKKKLSMARDAVGRGLAHKAVLHSQKNVLDWLGKKYPESIQIKDNEARTCLHYAGISKNPTDMYNFLLNLGCNAEGIDIHGRKASYYLTNPQELYIEGVNGSGGGGGFGRRGTRKKFQTSNRRRISPISPKSSPSPPISTMMSSSSSQQQQNMNQNQSSSAGGIPKMFPLTSSITRAQIRIWIHEKDISKLEQIVWSGNGDKLLLETTNNPKVRRFLDNVPSLLHQIKLIHTAAIHNDVEGLKEIRSRIEEACSNGGASPTGMVNSGSIATELFSARDSYGLSAMHKATGLNNRTATEYLLYEFPTTLNLQDNFKRSPLHYAATRVSNDAQSSESIYNFLKRAGADPTLLDYKHNTADYYLTHPNECESFKYLRNIPDAPRVLSSERALIGWDRSNVVMQRTSPGGKRKISSSDEFSVTSPVNKVEENVDETSNKMRKEDETTTTTTETATAYEDEFDIEDVGDGYVADSDEGKYELNHEDVVIGDTVVLEEDEEEEEEKEEGVVEDSKEPEVVEEEPPPSSPQKSAEVEEEEMVEKQTLEDEPPEDNQEVEPEVAEPEVADPPELEPEPEQQPVTPTPDPTPEPEPEPEQMEVEEEEEEEEQQQEPPPPPSPEKSPEKSPTPNQEQDEPQDQEEYDPPPPQPQEEPPSYNTLAPSPQTVEHYIANSDMEALVNLVLRGRGHELTTQTSQNPEIQEFLNNVPAYMAKISSIHAASYSGNMRDLQSLLDRKRLAEAQDSKGRGPLHHAVLGNQSQVVRYLVNGYPQCIDLPDEAGRTALHYSAALNDSGVMYKVLIQAGADPNLRDALGNTPGIYLRRKDLLKLDDLVGGGTSPVGKKRKSNVDTWERPPTPYIAPIVAAPPSGNSRGAYNTAIITIPHDDDDDNNPHKNDDDDEPLELPVQNLSLLNSFYLEVLSKESESIWSRTWKKLTTGNSSEIANKYVKRYLSPKVFHKIKSRSTPRYNSTLLDCIKFYPQFFIVAPDPHAYNCFSEVFTSAICECNGVELASWGVRGHPGLVLQGSTPLSNSFPIIDLPSKFIHQVRVRVSRNIRPFGFIPIMKREELYDVQRIVKSAFTELEWFDLEVLEKDERSELSESKGVWFPEATKISRFWPKGRGFLCNENGSTQIWVNAEDHVDVVVQSQYGKLHPVLEDVVKLMDKFEGVCEFHENSQFGYLTVDPFRCGTGMKITFRLRLPNMMQNRAYMTQKCDDLKLSLKWKQKYTLFGSSNEILPDDWVEVENVKTFGQNENEIVLATINGVAELLKDEEDKARAIDRATTKKKEHGTTNNNNNSSSNSSGGSSGGVGATGIHLIGDLMRH